MNNKSDNVDFGTLKYETADLISYPIKELSEIPKIKEKLLVAYRKRIKKSYSSSIGKNMEYLLRDPVEDSVRSAFFVVADDRLFLCGVYAIACSPSRATTMSAFDPCGELFIYYHGSVISMQDYCFVASGFNKKDAWDINTAVILELDQGMTYAKYHEVYDDSEIRNIYYIDWVTKSTIAESYYTIYKNGSHIRTLNDCFGGDFGRPGTLRVKIGKGLTENYIYDVFDNKIHKILWPMNHVEDYAPVGWYKAYEVSEGTKYLLEDELFDYYYFSKSSMQVFYNIMELIPEDAELDFLENLLPYDTSINYCLKISKKVDQRALCKEFFRTDHAGPKIFDVLISAVVEYLENESGDTPLKYEKVWPKSTREAVIQEIESYFHVKREKVLDLLCSHYGAIITHYNKSWFLVEGPGGEVDYPRKIKKINRLNIRWKNEALLYNLVFSYFPDALYQYNEDWLEGLILDIFIPSRKVAIEYQGEQHYLPFEHLGGEEGLIERQKRDSIKRELCKKQGIRLIEWKYTTPVVSVHFVQAIKEIGIDITNITLDLSRKEAYEIGIKNYSKVNKSSGSPKRKNKAVIQVDLDGVIVKEYESAKEAGFELGISPKGIRDCACGDKKTYGGYMWVYK